jgi:hypothetical protein
MKDAEQDTRNHGRIRQNTGKAAAIFEPIPTGVTFLVELGTAIGATKSVA